MFITEQNTNMWTKMLKEEFGVQDTNKLDWVSEYAQVHNLYESSLGVNGTPANAGVVVPGQGVGPVYASPLNTMGMGNMALPGNGTAGNTPLQNFRAQTVGSGDIPVSTLPMALNIALTTIGLELLPVVPAKGPGILLSYMDNPYGGGKLGRFNETAFDGKGEGRENKPLYFKVIPADLGAAEYQKLVAALKAKVDQKIEITAEESATVEAAFKTVGRMDGALIFEVVSCKKDGDNVSLKEAIEKSGKITVEDAEFTASVDFAQTSVDFIPGFANFSTGKADPMSRAENETGTGNTIGLRLFTKWVEMGSYEVTGTVTRQQLQDLPLQGIDAVAKIMEAMQNELSQHINHIILKEVFAMGATNAYAQKVRQGVDFNLWMGSSAMDLSAFGAGMVDINGNDITAGWSVKNAIVNTSAENLATRQRRIMSKILAAANFINVTGRRGRGQWAVVSGSVATALQDVSGYVVAPMQNTLGQDTQNLYHAGTVAGIRIYVDPYMDWNDGRICVGRKGTSNEPGLIFSPYVLADQVTITAEGTMAPKMLINSRFALIPVGFYPELQYFTFAVGAEDGIV